MRPNPATTTSQPSPTAQAPTTHYVVGPYDSALPGPMRLHLDLRPGADGSPLGWGAEIVSARAELGYNHVGVEERVATQPVEWAPRALSLVEHLCGRCAQANTLAFVHAAESLSQLIVPNRAAYLRLVIVETERISSHLLNVAEIMGELGLPEKEAALRDLHERVVHAVSEWAGARMNHGLILYGGVARNIDDNVSRGLMLAMRQVERSLRAHVSAIINDQNVVARMVGLGVIRAREAAIGGLRGPVARASGVPVDIRAISPTGAYEDNGVTVVTQRTGDAYARLVVRLLECLESLRLVEQTLDDLPPGPVRGRGMPEMREGSAVGRAEGPRGEVFCWLRGGVNGVSRLHLSAGSFPSLGVIPGLLQGQRLEDLRLLLLSLDLCLACAER